jgi:hypothetical protein
MKTKAQLLPALALLALPLGLVAQTNQTTPANQSTPSNTAIGNTTVTERYGSYDGPRAGDMEFTITGTGFSNKDMDNSGGGVTFAVGSYLNDSGLELVVRQSIQYANTEDDSGVWVGATRLALDQHLFVRGSVHPFVGVNFGGIYGDVDETFIGGIEVGVKWYVQPRTFIFAMVDYAWTFDDTDDADDAFEEGGYQWSIGVGFNF